MQLSKALIYLLLFLLPTQLGKHFFLPFSYINGIRIDYLAPTIYLTDIIVLILIVISLRKFKLPILKKYILFAVIVLVHVALSLSPFVTIYRVLKLIEALTIFFLFQTKLNVKYILLSLNLAAFIQLLLSSLQMTMGKSLQGIFYLLGERYFTISTPGIAKVALQGVEILRPYGTFSHPNSLAGFYLLLYTFVLFEKRFSKLRILQYIFLGISTILIFISFSKITIIVFLLVNAFYISKYVSCKMCAVGRVIGLLVLSGIFVSAQGDPDSFQKRVTLMQNSLVILFQHPFFGTGLGSYLIAQSQFPNLYSYYFLQPVHNIFLLLLAEVGIPSFFLIFYFWSPYIKKTLTIFGGLMLILVLIFTGLFDHYWLTLQQNLLLVPVVFALLKNQKWG